MFKVSEQQASKIESMRIKLLN